MSDQQDLWNHIGELTMETRVLSLVIVHLLSREAKASDDPEGWVRNFAEEVHSSMDRANPPGAILSRVEDARGRLDHIFNAVRQRVGK
jgi:hypothetical protein